MTKRTQINYASESIEHLIPEWLSKKQWIDL